MHSLVAGDRAAGSQRARSRKSTAFLPLAAAWVWAVGLGGCGNPAAGSDPVGRVATPTEDKVVNLYIWADYLAPDTLAAFEKATGIKVRVSYFETNETLESRVLTGHSGFDVVVPTAAFLQRQIASGAYLALDKKRLPNLVNLDPAIMAKVALNDPGNAHAIVYAWGTYGIGFNVAAVAKAMPDTPVHDWRVIFDPTYAAKLAACGINIIDAPAGIVRLVLRYLGRDPNSPSQKDLVDAERVLLKIRPYVRNIDSSIDTEALANGDICIAVGYNGTFFQARQRAKEAGKSVRLDYVVPSEGSLLWFDMLAIPADAPNSANAHAFINYMMNPRVIADVSNFIGYANANAAASPLLDASLRADPSVYPPADEQRRLFVQTEDSPQQSRALTRIWQRFKTAQ